MLLLVCTVKCKVGFTNILHYLVKWPNSHVAPHYNHLDLWNVLVPLMMLLPSCDANTGVSNQRSHVAPHFSHPWCKECNGATPMASCDTDGNTSGISVTLPEKSYCTSFEESEPVFLILGIQWYQLLCCWKHMTLMPVQMLSNYHKVMFLT